MKIVFITPASDIRRNFFIRRGYGFYDRPSPITGPLILGKILKDAGHEVEVYEELYGDLDLISIEKADVIGFSTMTSNVNRAYYLADYFMNRGKRVIIGGFHASAMPEEAKTHCTQVIVGEAENVIKDAVELKIRDDIIYAPAVKNLDEVPFPDYSILKTPFKAVNVNTTRGCLNNCSFCTTTRMFFPYRERSAENIIEEIEIYKRMGVKYLNFQDNNFTANKDKVKQVLKLMVEKDLVFRDVFFFSRSDIADDDELLGLFRKIGRPVVLVGIESTNQKSLDLINKKQNSNELFGRLRKLAENKIKLSASIVLGLDFDTLDDIRNTVAFCKKIKSFAIQPPPLTIFPGTPLFEQFEKEGRIITKNWDYYDMMHVMFSPVNMTPLELQKEFFKALRKFYTFSSSFGILLNFGLITFLKRVLLTIVSKGWLLFTRFFEKKFYLMLKKYRKKPPESFGF